MPDIAYGPEAFHLVKTQLRGRTWLRTTLINPLTAREDLTALMDRPITP